VLDLHLEGRRMRMARDVGDRLPHDGQDLVGDALARGVDRPVEADPGVHRQCGSLVVDHLEQSGP
jgi:hypothetical protein